MAVETVEVITPGLMTTVQDAGRVNWEHLGIARGGALDYAAFTWANRLATNPPDAAVLEALLVGPVLRTSSEVWMATAGATTVQVDGRPEPGWAGFRARAGSTISIERLDGARGYIAFHGGIDVPLVLGSRSTIIESGFGGLHGRSLRAGDCLAIGASAEAHPDVPSLRHPLAPRPPEGLTVRIVPGPDEDEFPPATLSTLLSSSYRMSPRSNHIGIRLDGPLLEGGSRGSRISQPMPVGGIQVTPAGQPVILLNGRGTIGGYSLIGTVISTDVWRLGQLRPGDTVNFSKVTVEEAQSITRSVHAELGELRPIASAGSFVEESP